MGILADKTCQENLSLSRDELMTNRGDLGMPYFQTHIQAISILGTSHPDTCITNLQYIPKIFMFRYHYDNQ